MKENERIPVFVTRFLLADGYLDAAEYSDGMSLWGFAYAQSMETFRAFAIDESGKQVDKIDPQFWQSLFLDLFFATDTTRPGNLLFGRGIASGN